MVTTAHPVSEKTYVIPAWVHGLFLATAVANLLPFAVTLPETAALALKGFPVVLLCIATAAGLRTAFSRYRLFVAAGLALSALGDVVISGNFVFGIAAFLVAHVMYVVAMGGFTPQPGRQALGLIPGLVLWGAMYAILAPRVPADLYVPVVVYMTVISTMLGRAIGRVLGVGSSAALIMAVGAAFFVLSDGMIAFHRWVVPIPHERVAILGTYWLAQWLIVRSIPKA